MSNRNPMLTTSPATPGDLSVCDREPIHVPGSIQPHGVLLSLSEPDLVVLQASANCRGILGVPWEDAVGRPLATLLGEEAAGQLRQDLRGGALDRGSMYLRTLRPLHATRAVRVTGHRADGSAVLELEPTETDAEVSFRELYPLVRAFMSRAQVSEPPRELAQLAADEVRALTGFDRVLVYQFAPEWHGHVIAESRNAEVYESYLDLWFPASDIPAQARELYRVNPLRLIADAQAQPVPIRPETHPGTNRPLDLSLAVLRGVSPVHLEYLANMGVRASMSIAVLRDRQLWGLIACHHRAARQVPFEMRTACELIGQYLSQQLAARQQSDEFGDRLERKAIQASLVAQMAGEKNFVEGLRRDPEKLMRFAGAGGVAILFEDACTRIGRTPSEVQIRDLAGFLAHQGGEVFHTDCLRQEFPVANAFRDVGSGLLAIRLSKLYQSYVMWFRPELVRTVTWGGNPDKPVSLEGDGSVRVHPRKSFAQWRQVVEGHSARWHPSEVTTATELRNDIVGIVLRTAEELAQVAAELRRTNEELESFSYSVSHDLRAPYRHIVGYGELLRERAGASLDETSLRYLQTMMDAARGAGVLVDSLLAFSQISRSALAFTPIDLNRVVRDLRADLEPDMSGRQVEWAVDELPSISGDLEMVRVVFRNLLDNAVKYTSRRPVARIEIRALSLPGEVVVSVQDNGVGFDMRYVNKLFGTFQRLHSDREFPGTGIGLALIRRIITRHGGRTWAEGHLNHGSTFYVTFPHDPKGVR